MNFIKSRSIAVTLLLAVSALATTHAQTITVNGTGCPGASVTLGQGTIAINTATCGPVAVLTAPVINVPTPPQGTTSSPYSYTFTASGSTPLTWINSNVPPAGLTLNASTGTLSGIPTSVGMTTLNLTAANAAGTSPAVPVTINIVAPSGPPTITSLAPPSTATVGVAYSYQYTANGATPITYSVTSGSLPPGITLTPGGLLSGTPTTAAPSTTVTITATNSTSTAPSTFTITVAAAPVVSNNNGNGNAFGQKSLTGSDIPTPSKHGSVVGPGHQGASGAGPYLNAWAIDPTICNSPVAPSTTPATLPAISKLWYHNIDFDAYAPTSGNDLYAMNANEALIYRFVPTQIGPAAIMFTEATLAYPVTIFASISTKPCDFDAAKLAISASKDFCFLSTSSQAGIRIEVTDAPVSWGICKLKPNATYYFNLRFQAGGSILAGGTPADSCAVSNQAPCGGLFQFVR